MVPGPTSVKIVRCSELPPGFEELVRAATAEGFSFAARLERQWQAGLNRFDAGSEALLAAFVASELAGVAGLNVDPFAGDPRIGRLRHLYVLPRFRGRGVGTALTRDVVSLASSGFSLLRLRTRQAAAFYEKLGFSRCEAGDATHLLALPAELRLEERRS